MAAMDAMDACAENRHLDPSMRFNDDQERGEMPKNENAGLDPVALRGKLAAHDEGFAEFLAFPLSATV